MDTSESAQTIYRASTRVSREFKECIEKDLLILKSRIGGDVLSEIMSCSFLDNFFDLELNTTGFINALLKAGDLAEGSVVSYKKMDFRSFESCWDSVWKGKAHEDNRPCVCIDEFNLSGPDREVQLFARNAIRALGLVCITMGTNSSAGNLVSPLALCSTASANSGPSTNTVGLCGVQTSCCQVSKPIYRHGCRV